MLAAHLPVMQQIPLFSRTLKSGPLRNRLNPPMPLFPHHAEIVMSKGAMEDLLRRPASPLPGASLTMACRMSQ